VFSTPQFLEWAKKNVILVEIDSPRKKQLEPQLKAQNEELKRKFQIRGFPTVLFLDANEKQIGRSGYKPGGLSHSARDKPRERVDQIERFRPCFGSGESVP